MSAGEAIWIWLTVSIYLVGAITIMYYGIHFAWLAYEGWKRQGADPELKASADRAVREEEGKVATPIRR